MTENLWQLFEEIKTSPSPDGNDARLLDLAGRLREPEHNAENDRHLLVNVLGSLALLSQSGDEVAGHLAEAENAAAQVRRSPDRELAFFLLTEVALRTGHPEVSLRCAAEVKEEGLAAAGLESLHREAEYYRKQAEAGLTDPTMRATLAEAQEASRVDPELGRLPAEPGPA